MSISLIESCVKLIDETDKSSQERYDELRYYFRNKGFGDRNEEMGFFRDFFSHFFKSQFKVFEVEWQQFEDYNDNWYYYDIKEVKINQYLNLWFTGFDDTGEEAWKYTFNQIGFKGERNREYFAKLEKENNELRSHIDKVFIFLRALYDHYGGYYFIYVFGTRAKVKVTGSGIEIENEFID